MLIIILHVVLEDFGRAVKLNLRITSTKWYKQENGGY